MALEPIWSRDSRVQWVCTVPPETPFMYCAACFLRLLKGTKPKENKCWIFLWIFWKTAFVVNGQSWTNLTPNNVRQVFECFQYLFDITFCIKIFWKNLHVKFFFLRLLLFSSVLFLLFHRQLMESYTCRTPTSKERINEANRKSGIKVQLQL